MHFGSFITDLFWEAVIYGDNLCTSNIIFCNVLFLSLLLVLKYWFGLAFFISLCSLIIEFKFGVLFYIVFNLSEYLAPGLRTSIKFSLDSITLPSCFSYVASQSSFCLYSPESSRFLEVLLHSLLYISSLLMTSISVYNWSICIEVTFAVSLSLRVLQINCKCFIVIST